jgi:hypothetical protein
MGTLIVATNTAILVDTNLRRNPYAPRSTTQLQETKILYDANPKESTEDA